MSRNRTAVAHVWVACLVVSGFTFPGCSPPEMPKGTVAGTVTFKGLPVTSGEVELYCQGVGVGATAKLDAAGRFVVNVPIATGTYQACVNPPVVIPDPDAPPTKQKTFPNIPVKARDLSTSGLLVSVNKGDNFIELELKD